MSRSASRCPARCGCNGGPTCWRARGHGGVEGNPVAAELLLDDPQSPPAGLAILSLGRGAPVRSLQRPDAVAVPRSRAISMPPLRRYSRKPRASWRGHRRRSIIWPVMPVSPRAWRRPSQRSAAMRRGNSCFCRYHCSSSTAAARRRCLPASRRRTSVPRSISSPDEAQEHLKTAFGLLADVPSGARRIFLPLACVRRELNRARRADYDPFLPKAGLAPAYAYGHCGARRARRNSADP